MVPKYTYSARGVFDLQPTLGKFKLQSGFLVSMEKVKCDRDQISLCANLKKQKKKTQNEKCVVLSYLSFNIITGTLVYFDSSLETQMMSHFHHFNMLALNTRSILGYNSCFINNM